MRKCCLGDVFNNAQYLIAGRDKAMLFSEYFNQYDLISCSFLHRILFKRN